MLPVLKVTHLQFYQIVSSTCSKILNSLLSCISLLTESAVKMSDLLSKPTANGLAYKNAFHFFQCRKVFFNIQTTFDHVCTECPCPTRPL